MKINNIPVKKEVSPPVITGKAFQIGMYLGEKIKDTGWTEDKIGNSHRYVTYKYTDDKIYILSKRNMLNKFSIGDHRTSDKVSIKWKDEIVETKTERNNRISVRKKATIIDQLYPESQKIRKERWIQKIEEEHENKPPTMKKKIVNQNLKQMKAEKNTSRQVEQQIIEKYNMKPPHQKIKDKLPNYISKIVCTCGNELIEP